MSKAEYLAEKAYPEGDTYIFGDASIACRVAYVKGYNQAEEELIDKAVGWIKEINTHHHIMRYSDSCEPPLSELTEWFKNYMKEENINSK